MFRFLIYSVVAIFVITLVRAFLSIILKGFGELFSSPSEPQHSQSPSRPEVTDGGELRKDPVCGAYVAEGAAVKYATGGQTLFFCSKACLDKYRSR